MENILNSAIIRPRPMNATALLLICCAFVSSFIDITTNIFLYYGIQSSIAVAGKGLVLTLVIASLRQRFSATIIAIIFFTHLSRTLSFALLGHPLELLDNATFFFRILTLVAWLLILNERKNDIRLMHWLLIVFVAVAVINALSGLLGAALDLSFFKAYEGARNGYKGIFFSENDTGIFYMVSLVFGLANWRRSLHWKVFVFLMFAGAINLGLGSKTALLAALIVPAVFIYLNKSEIKLSIAIILFISIFFTFAFIFINWQEILMAIGYEQFIRVYTETDIVTVITSFRNLKALSWWNSMNTINDWLFGNYIISPAAVVLGTGSSGTYMIEIDMLDIIFRTGLIGLTTILYAIYVTTNPTERFPRSDPLKGLIFLLFITGLMTGHTLVSSMNAIWIAFGLVYFGIPPELLAKPPAIKYPAKKTLIPS